MRLNEKTMEPAEKKRLLRYILLLILVIGGMVYLNQLLDHAADKPVETVATSPGEGRRSVQEAFVPEPFPYGSKVPSRDGTGKVYMGREISHVMGHAAIGWLERDNREDEEAPSKAVKGLELKPDAVVADIGSGSGYYTFKIAPLVPKGKVIGVDVQPEMVAFLGKKAAEGNVQNVEAHLGKIDSVQLPGESMDAVIMVDAYHEFSHPNEMMQSIYHALRPGGRVYLLEYRAEDEEVPIKPLHKMTEFQAIAEMEAVGLKHLRTEGFLPWQHFMVFEKK